MHVGDLDNWFSSINSICLHIAYSLFGYWSRLVQYNIILQTALVMTELEYRSTQKRHPIPHGRAMGYLLWASQQNWPRTSVSFTLTLFTLSSAAIRSVFALEKTQPLTHDKYISIRGVARRRTRGLGLNLKMLKKIYNNPKKTDPFSHKILYCHVEHCHFKSLLLASLRSLDTNFVVFYISVFTDV